MLLDDGTNASLKGSAGRPESSVLAMCPNREVPAEPVLPICIFPVNGADPAELALPNTDSVDSVDWTLPNSKDAEVVPEGSLAKYSSSGELEPSKRLLPAVNLPSFFLLFPVKKSLNLADGGLT